MPLREEGYFLRTNFLTHATVGWSDADRGTPQAALPQLEKRNFDAHKRIFKTNVVGDADEAQKMGTRAFNLFSARLHGGKNSDEHAD